MAGVARWLPLTGFAFVGLALGCFALTDGSPDTGNDNASIVAWYLKSGNQDKVIAGFFMLLAASLFFMWFMTILRGRLARSEGAAGTLTALAFGAGIAAAALWIVSAALFSAPAFTADDTKKFTLDPNTYRILEDTGYVVWFSGTTVAAATVTATALLALRTGMLPKWLAWLSFPVALTMLVAFFFIPFLIMCGWILVVAITLIVRREAPEAVAAPAPA